MESGKYANVIQDEDTKDWYSEEFIYQTLTVYLKKNGYKIHEEKPNLVTGKTERIIVVSKFFTKEIIGIKGLQQTADRISLLIVLDKNDTSPHTKNWFSDSLFNSFINFGKYYSDDNAVGAMALPSVERYRAIIDKVQEYFKSNNLNFKVYLVDQNAEVEIINFNNRDSK